MCRCNHCISVNNNPPSTSFLTKLYSVIIVLMALDVAMYGEQISLKTHIGCALMVVMLEIIFDHMDR